MFTKPVFAGLLFAGLSLALPAAAQESAPWADAAVPEVRYEFPLAGYQHYSPQTPGDWREANETVARIGGWQAYAAEVWEARRERRGDQPSEESPHQHHDH